MKRLNLAVVLLLAGGAFAAPQADLARGKAVVDQICAACHGADGNSNTYPRLASQHAAYIVEQTKAIKEGKRVTGAAATMAPMVQSLSDDDIRDAAAYFAKQNVKSGEANPKDNPELGKKIYRGGIADKKVPACMSCHGPSGAGMPAGGTAVLAYPRVSSQQSAYVVEQLNAYASGQRKSPNGMMEDIAGRLSDEEKKAVATYIQGLR